MRAKDWVPERWVTTPAEPPPETAGPRPRPTPVAGEAILPDGTRRLGLAWIGFSILLTAAVGTAVHNPEGFLVYMPLTSGLFTVPAMVAVAAIVRRVAAPDRRFWQWYLGGNIGLYLIGSAIVAVGLRARLAYELITFVALSVVIVCDAMAVDHMLRQRSGSRSRSVDVVESGLAIVLVTAPVVVLYGETVVSSPYAWFGLLALVCMAVFTSALWCTVVLFVRSPRGRRRAEAVGVALWVAALIDTTIQIEQVVNGFSLPPAPVLAFNGLCMGLLLLVPLYAPYRHARGREGLPPQAQIRTGKVIAAVTLAALPLLAGAVAVSGASIISVRIAGVALVLLVGLSAVRQLLTYSETRRLYAEVERSAEDRRALLAAVLGSMDADRQRVAVQLHRQASSSYAALASLVPPDGRRSEVGDVSAAGLETARRDVWMSRLRTRPEPDPVVSHLLTERMAAQAESLRELIGAIEPRARGGRAGLEPILQAYVDSVELVPPAVVRIEVAEGLVLDWVTETVALRVVQEAVRNTCRHAEASELCVTIDVEGDVPVVRVRDDGIGFAGGDGEPGSGIATMRRFVDFCGGELRITPVAGGGTQVEARLGGPPPVPSWAPRLRPVRG